MVYDVVFELVARADEALFIVEGVIDGLVGTVVVEGEQTLVVRRIDTPTKVVGCGSRWRIVSNAEGGLEHHHGQRVGVGDQQNGSEEVRTKTFIRGPLITHVGVLPRETIDLVGEQAVAAMPHRDPAVLAAAQRIHQIEGWIVTLKSLKAGFEEHATTASGALGLAGTLGHQQGWNGEKPSRQQDSQ